MEKLATEFNMSFPEEKIILNGKMEESPYTLKQEKMIYRYTSLENTQERIDNYEEANFSEKEREYYQEL